MEEPVPVKDILDPRLYRDQMVVMGIKGRITAIYKETSGEGTHSHYTYQNAELQGEDGGKIKIKFSSCSQPLSAKGKVVQISSYKHDSHGWLGIKVKDEEYDGKKGHVKERLLQVSSTAEIQYEGGDPAPDKSGQQQSGGSTGGGYQPPQNDRHPILVLKDISLLHGKVVDIVNETYPGETPDQVEFRKTATATIFIEAARQGIVHNFEKRIAAPVPAEYPPAPTDPTRWKECVIPKGEYAGKTLDELPDERLLELNDALSAKESNSDFAECVYQAASDRNVLPPPPPPPQRQQQPPSKPDVPEDDIPF